MTEVSVAVACLLRALIGRSLLLEPEPLLALVDVVATAVDKRRLGLALLNPLQVVET